MTEDGHDGRDGHDARTVAVLRRRLRAADEEIAPPPGLWDRVRAQAPAQVPTTARPNARRLAVVLAAAAVALVAGGTWWWVRPGGSEPQQPAGPGPGLELAVYNAEEPCQELRTLECSLRLAIDPYAEYAAPDNAAGRVWHGDRLAADCVVTDGTRIVDEDGISSTRWYRVRTAGGVEGWLPGVRTRNHREVPLCGEEP